MWETAFQEMSYIESGLIYPQAEYKAINIRYCLIHEWFLSAFLCVNDFFQLENELHTVSHRLTQVTDDKNKIEDKLSSIEAAHMLSQDQANQLQVYNRQSNTSFDWLDG